MQRLKGLEIISAATAQRVKGLKIVWAAALALGLFQFSLLGLRMVGPNPSVWSVYVWPYLSRLLLATVVVAAALVSGILIRPQRPERIAAAVGAVGGSCVLGLDLLGQIISRIGEMVGPLLAGLPPSGGRIHTFLLPQTVNIVSLVTVAYALPLAVACWLGANYWRSDSWQRFWRGPGGAILRGGLVAGAICMPLSIAAGWWRYERLQELREHIATPLHPGRPWPGYPWGNLLVSSPSGITSGAVIAAILATRRPKPVVGAFAGSGLVLGIGVLFLALSLWTSPPPEPFGLRTVLALQVPRLLVSAVLGAIAGSFAGRWEDEPTE